MALAHAGLEYELREVSLKQKPPQMLALSSKGTVPVLQLETRVIDESLEIIAWALNQAGSAHSNPAHSNSDSWAEADFPHPLVEANDGEFKYYLDRYKYFERFPEHPQSYYLDKCMTFLNDLEERLTQAEYLLGAKICWVDVAIFPFIRQFAFVDKIVFDDLALPMLQNWLDRRLGSELFSSAMIKHPFWQEGQAGLYSNSPP